MPKIKIAQRKKTAKERVLELREKSKSKKNKGEKLTVKDLEDRLEALEDAVFTPDHES